MASDLVIRRIDFTLSEDEQAVSESFQEFLKDNCPTSRVREGEPLGFDRALWSGLCQLGAVSMAVDSDAGGDGGTLVQAALIAEHCGASVAPVPFAESVAVARLLGRIGGSAGDWLADVMAGRRVVGLASRSGLKGWPQLIGSGAVADAVIGIVDGDLVLIEATGERPKHVLSQGNLPTAYWSPDSGTVTTLVSGASATALFEQACDEYKVLTASALAGLGSAVIGLASDFATTRMTRGVPIGSLQGVSHPLVDAKIAVEGARQTARKAAWYCQYEPDSDPKLPGVAFVGATRAAERAARVSVHMHGGLGVMIEGEPSLYFLRAVSWSAVVGSVADELARLAKILDTPRYLDVVYPSML